MFQKISKALHFCFFFPIAFISPTIQQKIYKIWQLTKAYSTEHMQMTGILLISGVVLVVLYLHSVFIFVYDENNVPVCVGNLIVLHHRNMELRLPRRMIDRAETSRFMIRMTPYMCKAYRKKQILVKYQSWYTYLQVHRSMYFEIPLRRNRRQKMWETL